MSHAAPNQLPFAPKPVAPEPVTVDPARPTAPRSWLKRHRKLLLIIAGTLVAAGVSGGLGWFLASPVAVPTPSPTATPTPTPTPSPTPVTKASPLTGVAVDPALADRPIHSIIVENSPDARPQSGLQDAGVVYEALAEGGITRFQTFFLDQKPPQIGPVRSLRPYFVDWGLEFNAPVSHAGGSATALGLIGPLHMKDINALSFGSSAFFRTSDRVAPHNLYTSTDRMDALLIKLGFGQPANFTVSPRKADAPNPAPPHADVNINYSSPGFAVRYRYDSVTNSYARFLAGTPHVDRNTGKQITVKNIVIEMMPTTTLSDGHMQMTTVGSGKGWVLRDGDAVACTWIKEGNNVRTRLVDATGADIPLNPGNTWYSIVPIGKTVSF